jgi:uncharacterized protein (DUF305 family)
MNGARTAQSVSGRVVHGVMRSAVAVIGAVLVALIGGCAGAPSAPAPAGMADPAALERLRTLSGPAFDRLWLRTMTSHHEGAVAMAGRQLAATGGAASTSALAEFSRTLLVAQQAEIDRMRGLLARG